CVLPCLQSSLCPPTCNLFQSNIFLSPAWRACDLKDIRESVPVKIKLMASIKRALLRSTMAVGQPPSRVLLSRRMYAADELSTSTQQSPCSREFVMRSIQIHRALS